MNDRKQGAYGADSDILDYVLGTNFEIWAQGEVDLVSQYYGRDVCVYGLDGVVHGATAIMDATRDMLASYPDRLLLSDDVIWSGNRLEGYYASHRTLSPMTNRGDTLFGPATGRHVDMLEIADRFVEEGVITRAWSMRDNHALVAQLGHDPLAAATILAGRRDERSARWLSFEIDRLGRAGIDTEFLVPAAAAESAHEFAAQVVPSLWAPGGPGDLERFYQPYAVLHRSPTAVFSGREAVLDHYAGLRGAFNAVGASIDHVAMQSRAPGQLEVAARWTVAGQHVGPYLGLAATGRMALVLGASHWRVVQERIAIEWTVFDGLGVLAQLVD